MNTKKEFNDADYIVRKCLEEDVRCRNDDMYLCIKVWAKQGFILNIDPMKIKEMINPETIIRNRAFIQNNECNYLPTDVQVITKRRMKENNVRQYFGEKSNIYNEYKERYYNIK